MTSIRAKIKEITALRWRLKEPIDVIVDELNRVLRGWCHYFRWGNSTRQVTQIDVYVRERLALFDSKKRGRHGRRWGQVHTTTWYARLGIFTLSGTVRYIHQATATT
jgi:RNA-directed DNA polymerase